MPQKACMRCGHTEAAHRRGRAKMADGEVCKRFRKTAPRPRRPQFRDAPNHSVILVTPYGIVDIGS